MVGAGVRHMVGAGVCHMVGVGVCWLVQVCVTHGWSGVYAHCTYTFWLCLLCLMCW